MTVRTATESPQSLYTVRKIQSLEDDPIQVLLFHLRGNGFDEIKYLPLLSGADSTDLIRPAIRIIGGQTGGLNERWAFEKGFFAQRDVKCAARRRRHRLTRSMSTATRPGQPACLKAQACSR